ncbi:MAG: hypothetical protein AAGF01_25225 [Cyanobacteria bacterium P01_G01_bin.38]
MTQPGLHDSPLLDKVTQRAAFAVGESEPKLEFVSHESPLFEAVFPVQSTSATVSLPPSLTASLGAPPTQDTLTGQSLARTVAFSDGCNTCNYDPDRGDGFEPSNTGSDYGEGILGDNGGNFGSDAGESGSDLLGQPVQPVLSTKYEELAEQLENLETRLEQEFEDRREDWQTSQSTLQPADLHLATEAGEFVDSAEGQLEAAQEAMNEGDYDSADSLIDGAEDALDAAEGYIDALESFPKRETPTPQITRVGQSIQLTGGESDVQGRARVSDGAWSAWTPLAQLPGWSSSGLETYHWQPDTSTPTVGTFDLEWRNPSTGQVVGLYGINP